MNSPEFWHHPCGLRACLLAPLSWLYTLCGILRKWFIKPVKASVPVISIGNFTLGGAGKTPVTIAIAQCLQKIGKNPHIISRGYQGSLQGPVQVDINTHHYHQTGDEPLLLARVAPVWISKNRALAAGPACQSGADILVLDDGHQNHSLIKDMRIMVVDSQQKFGNGQVFPAGPLRQSVEAGLKQTDVIILIGDETSPVPLELLSLSCPLLRARMIPLFPEPQSGEKPVVAFAGLGYPEKFRQTLVNAGFDVRAFVPFPDHYPYSPVDLKRLEEEAHRHKADLVTTEKDYVRIPLKCRKSIKAIAIELEFYPADVLEKCIRKYLEQADSPWP
jgi:tetraacyldisaccharide 4'-kinase